MKTYSLLLTLICCISVSCGCGGKSTKLDVPDDALVETSVVPGTEAEIPMKSLTVGQKTYNVADITDDSHE